MSEKKINPSQDPASKSKVKGPRIYQGYIIAAIILIIVIIYSFMYW